MADPDLLLELLRATGLDVVSVTPTAGGVVALAGLAALRDGSQLFAKTLPGTDSDVFAIEAEGRGHFGRSAA